MCITTQDFNSPTSVKTVIADQRIICIFLNLVEMRLVNYKQIMFWLVKVNSELLQIIPGISHNYNRIRKDYSYFNNEILLKQLGKATFRQMKITYLHRACITLCI